MYGQAQTLQEASADIPKVVASTRSTVVLLKSFDRRGKVLGLGSGFRIAGGRFVTNAHVVAGASRVEIFDDGGALLGIARYAEMLSTTVDLAILPAVGARTPALPLASVPPLVGEQVIVIGAPEGLTNTVSDGIVSAVRKVESRQLLQITAPISPGSSGGPVLNRRGEVVGVSVSILREGQNLNFAVPVADVIALVASRPGQIEFPVARDVVGHPSNGQERSGRTTPTMTFPLLPFGSDVSGAITTKDRLSNGQYVRYYHINGVEGVSVSIGVSSDDFDPFVAVYRVVADSVVLVTGDDDGGVGLNANARLTFPADDMYFVGVFATPSSRSKLGDYTIRLSAQTGQPSSAAASGKGEPRWLPAGRNNDDRNEFDRTSIISTGYQTYLVWERATFATPYTDKAGDTVDVVLLRYEVSCSEHRFRLRSGAKYLKKELVRSSTIDGEWQAAIPETIGETSTNAVCAYVKAHGL